VGWYGAYYIDPKYLVFWISVQSDALKKQLSDNTMLNNALRDILIKNDYPLAALSNCKAFFNDNAIVFYIAKLFCFN
jgi:hypothetical protein